FGNPVVEVEKLVGGTPFDGLRFGRRAGTATQDVSDLFRKVSGVTAPEGNHSIGSKIRVAGHHRDAQGERLADGRGVAIEVGGANEDVDLLHDSKRDVVREFPGHHEIAVKVARVDGCAADEQ